MPQPGADGNAGGLGYAGAMVPPVTTPPPRPRLVRPADEPPAQVAAGPTRPGRRSPLLPAALAVATAAALAAGGGWAVSSRRVAALESQVAELGGALDAARAEITARQLHLEELRGAAADLEDRVAALRVLAERAPTVPAPPAVPAGD